MEESPPRESGASEETETRAQESKESKSVRQSLRVVFSWRNYSVYLFTVWVYSGFTVIYEFFNLYLRKLGWDFVLIGVVVSVILAISAIARFVGGYIGDVTDRKKLSVVAMFMLATNHLILGIFTDFIFILGALIIYASMDLAKGGSTAYIMENIPKEHSGLALSLFQSGRSWGILTLTAFGLMMPVVGFPEGLRLLYLISGLLLLASTVARAALLSPSPQKGRAKDKPLWRDFISENKQAVKLILSFMPGVLAIVVLDGISDSIWRYGALIYTNEILRIDVGGINIMVLIPLIVSLPLLLKVGRLSDTRGIKRATLLVYSVMPICAGLLIVAPAFPIWAPQSVIVAADSLIDGLGVVFTTPFLAIVAKLINDSLWALVLITLIQKSMPRTDTAKVLGVFWTIVYIVSSIGPFFGGLIYQFMNPSTMFAVVMVTNLLILLGIARYRFERENPDTLTGRIDALESRIQKLRREIEDFRTQRKL
ncbi:MAG: MFS transporter [Candidatus Thorarchaeota archaeon]